MAIGQGVMAKPAVADKLLEQGALGVFMDILRQASPAELVSTAGYARRPHGNALWVVGMLAEAAEAGGTDLSGQLLSCGFIDVVVSALSAVEQIGAENANGWTVVGGLLYPLKGLNGQALGEIEEKLRSIPSALRYVKDHDITHIADLGWHSGSFATTVAANLFGQDEDNVFGFARECTPDRQAGRVGLVRR
jgi:hypothetical protein